MNEHRYKLVTIVVILFMVAQTILGSMPANVAATSSGQPSSMVAMKSKGQSYDGRKMTSAPVTIEATTSAAIEYSTNHGVAWQPYTEPITVTGTGVHPYLFREVGTVSTDTANVHIMPSPAEQKITTTADTIYVNETASRGGDGTSWNSAYTDLQQALDVSTQKVSSGDSVQIFVAEGTYRPSVQVDASDPRSATFQMQNKVAIYGGFDAATDERDIEANPTILSGDINNTPTTDTDNAYHVFYHPSGTKLDTTAVLDGVTITGGHANGTNPHNHGGGMYNDSSSPTLENVTIIDNTATSSGGGMYNDFYSSPTLENVTIIDNTATSWGGGMSNSSISSPKLANVTINGNTATSNGGGMYNDFYSSPTLENVTISGNTAANGGGMSNYNGSSPTLANMTISGNTASNGGGMSNSNSSPKLENVTISGNTATSNGGGMFNLNSSIPKLENVTISGNTATSNGGGMYNDNLSSPTLENVTISGNTATSNGGGMSNYYGSSPTLENVTISGNTATSSGGGMYNFDNSNPTLKNMTMTGNKSTGTDKGAIYGGGGTIHNSLIVGNNDEPALTAYTGTTLTSMLDVASSDTIEVKFYDSNGDRLSDAYQLQDIFIDLHQLNYRLRANSPAINKGDNGLNLTQTDLDGNPRIQGSAIDLGAYEVPHYDVLYKKNGATSGDVPLKDSAYAQQEVTVQSNTGQLVRTGHAFIGWNLAADGSGTSHEAGKTFTMDTANVTLYAQWEPANYTVSFDAQGGTAIPSQTIQYNEKVVVPTPPTKVGSTFTGWYLNNVAWDFATPITEAMTLTAKWRAVSTGGGSSTPSPNVTPILQQVLENGELRYRATLIRENVPSIIAPNVGSSERAAHVVFPSEPWVEATLTATSGTVNDLVNQQTDVFVETALATILVPHTSLNGWTEDLFFRIVPVKSDRQETIAENAQQNEQVQAFVGHQMTVNLFGQPVTIETNMQNRPVTITLPIPTDTTAEQLQSLFVYIEHSDGTTEVKRGRIVEMAPGVQGIAFDVTHFSTFSLFYATENPIEEPTPEPQPEPTPTPTPEPTTLAPYIQGYPDGTFKPNAAVTRAQMATMLARFLTNGDIPTAEATFTDTAKSDAKDAIEFVKQSGLFNGKTATTFGPNDTITRAQMASVVARWIETVCAQEESKAYCTSKGEGKLFTDVKPTHWATQAIEKVSARGIMTGNSATTFHPNGTLTRAQAVKVLNQLFERPAVDNITESTFQDVPASYWALEEIEAAATEMIIKP